VLSAAPWLAPPKHTPDSGSRETLAEPSSEHSAAAPRRSAIGCQKSFRAIAMHSASIGIDASA
jgi:hypothetical protein